MKILDVGCGDNPKGDVNLDLFFYVRCENFVIGEAHHLPFKTGVLENVYCKHCLEHLENPLQFFKEAKRVLKDGGTLTCIYPTNSMLTKKTIHNLLNLRWSSAFKWKTKLTGKEKITYGGHKWQFSDEGVLNLLLKAGFEKVSFQKTYFPLIRTDRDAKNRKWKIFFNKYLPGWQLETELRAKAKANNHARHQNPLLW